MARFALLIGLALFICFALMKNWKRPAGILLVFTAVIAGFFYHNMKKIDDEAKIVPAAKTVDTVHILYSGDKKTLLNDADFQELLKKQYGLVIDSVKTDFSDSELLKKTDGIWFSGDAEQRGFDQKHPDVKYQAKTIFQTRVVIYSWADVAKTLIHQGIVEKKAEIYALVNLKKLEGMQGRTWESVGLSGGYDTIRIVSDDSDNKLPLFDRYLKQGQLDYPLIRGYENAMIELYQTQPGYREKLKDTRVLIPEPLTLSPHPFAAFTPKGKTLLAALEKPDIQKFISTRYGLRSSAGEISPEVIKALGLVE